MSENPNPTRCGNCGTMNPPGQEECRHCHAPLTIAASAAEGEASPAAPDEPRRYAASDDDKDVPEGGPMGGLEGASYGIPKDQLDQDPTKPRRT